MPVTVYTKDYCPACTATKRKLTALNVSFVEKNVDQDPVARDKIIALGFMQMPVVITQDDSWFGYDPPKLDALAA